LSRRLKGVADLPPSPAADDPTNLRLSVVARDRGEWTPALLTG
jgi:hypothetical protein